MLGAVTIGGVYYLGVRNGSRRTRVGNDDETNDQSMIMLEPEHESEISLHNHDNNNQAKRSV